MKAYKLTNIDGKTKYNTQWGSGIGHTVNFDTPFKPLCSCAWIHFYKDPLLAIFMNPSHAGFNPTRLWECETFGKHLHEPLKSGCKTLTTIKEIPVPEISDVQKKAFGILCAKEVCKEEEWNEWNEWANKWLSGKHRYALTNKPFYGLSIAIWCTPTFYTCWDFHSNIADLVSKQKKDLDFIALAKKAMTYV